MENQKQASSGFVADVEAAAGGRPAEVDGAVSAEQPGIQVVPQKTLADFVTDENTKDFIAWVFFRPLAKRDHPAWMPPDADLLEAAPPIREGAAELLDKLVPEAVMGWANRFPAAFKGAIVLGTLMYTRWRIVSEIKAEQAASLAAAQQRYSADVAERREAASGADLDLPQAA